MDRGWGKPGVLSTNLTRVQAAGIPINVRTEIAVPTHRLVTSLAVARKAHGAPPLASSGAYNFRPIRGYTKAQALANISRWSNHSWALALDLNAGTNGMTTRHPAPTDFPREETRAIAAECGFSWGGDWSGRADPMHFEFLGTPKTAGIITARLLANGSYEVTTAPTRNPFLEDDDMLMILQDGKNNYISDGMYKRRIITVEEDVSLRATGIPAYKVLERVTANIPDQK